MATLPPPPPGGTPSARWFQLLWDTLRGISDSSGLVTLAGTQTLTNKTIRNVVDDTRAYAIATSAAGQSFADATVTIVDFDTVEADSRSAVTTGAAWRFTVPAGHAGLYQVSASVTMLGGGVANDNNLYVYKNGAAVRRLQLVSAATNQTCGGTVLLSLAAGDYIDIRFRQGTGGTRSLTTSSVDNWVSILRVVADV